MIGTSFVQEPIAKLITGHKKRISTVSEQQCEQNTSVIANQELMITPRVYEPDSCDCLGSIYPLPYLNDPWVSIQKNMIY